MRPDVLLTGLAALVASAGLTAVVRKVAISWGALDIPNARSSHTQATPRGGGIAIVTVTTAALLALNDLGPLWAELRLALIGGGLLVALTGLVDDRYTLPAGARLAVHAAAAAWALFCLGGLPPLQVGGQSVPLGVAGDLLALAAIMWTINLFNFMDGIDGIAVSEAVFVAGAGALLTVAAGSHGAVPAAALVVAAACVGFLPWNWPRARIFMGDVGSGYLGFVLSVLALAAAHDNPTILWVWLILGGVFFVDATTTLLRRMVRRERLHQAHRTHAYQWLARRWHSHLRVTLAVQAVNLGWLLPCALLAGLRPSLAAGTVIVALLPLAGIALALGAGRREEPPGTHDAPSGDGKPTH
jgi:Fuc2NAc and GlcNAc transferase